jgi:xanthine dehydrogenase large subunit
MPGVVRVLTACDIPGKNNFARPDGSPEELLATDKCMYAGQPVALVVAGTPKMICSLLNSAQRGKVYQFSLVISVSQDIAEKAAKLVDIQYENIQTPIITCQDAIKANSFFHPFDDIRVGDAAAAVMSAPRTVKGDLELGSQHHFHMETMVGRNFKTQIEIEKKEILEKVSR